MRYLTEALAQACNSAESGNTLRVWFGAHRRPMLISRVAVRSKNMGSARIMTSLNVASLAANFEVDSSTSAERVHNVSCLTVVLEEDYALLRSIYQ